MTAVEVLHARVLPFYEEQGGVGEHLLTDNGHEFWGRPVHHPYALFLAVQQIEHRNTTGPAPSTQGCCERFHRTVSDAFFTVKFRQQWSHRLAELQEDLDAWLEEYNTVRPHPGYRTQGRTPRQAFREGLAPMPKEEELPPAA